MISHHLLVPFQISPTQYNLLIIMTPGGLERMRQYDPCEIHIGEVVEQMGPEWQKLTLNQISIGFLEEWEREEVIDRKKSGEIDFKKIYDRVYRGFKFRPELGDHDKGPEHIQPEGT